MLLDYLPSFQEWLRKRGKALLFVLIIMLIPTIQSLLEETVQPIYITYSIDISSYPSKQLWRKDEFYSLMAPSSKRRVFLMQSPTNNLFAVDSKVGNTIWSIEPPIGQGGVRGLLANENTVFIITTLNVNAYKAETGELQWSTKLGNGHVGIISQLDSDILRIYYGNDIHEIDTETGEILMSYPKDDTLWVLNNIVLKARYPFGIDAFVKQTDEFLWRQEQSFFVEENLVPQNLDEDVIFVWQKPASSLIGGICALDLKTGEYIWCRIENFNSVMAVDGQSKYGYALRDDNTLLMINLQTGHTMNERNFFSKNLPPLAMGASPSIIVNNGNVIVSFIELIE